MPAPLRVNDVEVFVNTALKWMGLLGGVMGIIYTALKYPSVVELLKERFGSFSIVNSALAAPNFTTEIGPIIPYILVGVIAMMGTAFLAAVAASLLMKNTKDNHERIKTADNIIKTFGGFFTGFALALFK